jgi:uncharacterized protein (TIGR02145 family)
MTTILRSIFLSGFIMFYGLSWAQFKSVRIGKQIWMAENLSIDVPGSYLFNGKAEYEKKYGRLYTYEAALKACPAGWRLPSDADWDELTNALGGEEIAANALRTGGSSGFNAPLAGYANGSSFWFLEAYGGYWSADSYDNGHAWYRFFTNKDGSLTKTYFNKKYGFSVRCIKN